MGATLEMQSTKLLSNLIFDSIVPKLQKDEQRTSST